MSEPADMHATHRATDCYDAAYPVALDEPTRAQLDHPYWMTDTPVRAIAERLDLTGRSVSSLVTPLPAGFAAIAVEPSTTTPAEVVAPKPAPSDGGPGPSRAPPAGRDADRRR